MRWQYSLSLFIYCINEVVSVKGKIKIKDELKASYRRGIVKELYSRKMITEQQYKRLLMK